MTAAPEGAVDGTEVRRFVGLVHAAAAHALDGANDPGLLQLSVLDARTDDGSMQSSRWAIGDVDGMAGAAIRAAETGLNVYVEGRTLDRRSRGRGRAGETRGVFAFVDDSDADKGRAGALGIEPSLVVESSPGNRHNWLFLDRALEPREAEPIGRAIRAAAGSDSATGKLTQPYRVAGTPNFPGPRKRARGRVTTPTRIISADGRVWAADELRAAFPAVAPEPLHATPAGSSSATSETVEALAADTTAGLDRSAQFFKCLVAAIRAGMLPGDLEEVLRRHPDGCASKYIEPQDRLAAEIVRPWAKAAARAARPSVAPEYPDRSVPVDEARTATREAIAAHFAARMGCRALRVGTGIGKTRIAVELVAAEIRARRAIGDRSRFLYAVPRHRLGDEIAGLFAARGVTARVYRGRQAEDPDVSGTGHAMCLDMAAVELALSIGATVSTSCCDGDDPLTGKRVRCPLFTNCGFQRQLLDKPDVWIASHQILFQAPSAMDRVAGVVIDEGFWGSGLRQAGKGLTLDELAATPPGPNGPTSTWAAVATQRARLARALRNQSHVGGVERRHLVDANLTIEECTSAIAGEWTFKTPARMWPGMEAKARREAAKGAGGTKRIKTFVGVWHAARELLRDDRPDTASGRLVLADTETPEGIARVVRTRGVRPIAEKWADLPTLLMDATLPDPAILRQFHPGVDLIAEIEAKAPHARVRQVLGAPVSAGKLLRSDAGRNLRAIRHAILYRFVEAGRGPTLVIAQQAVVERLQASGLPSGIALGHFNAIAGLDTFKRVRLLIVIGRTMPNVLAVEAEAGALTGLEVPQTPSPANDGPRWYDKAFAGLRMADGSGFAVEVDRHPDATAEAVRWQAAEAEVIQAIGRARAVNRTAADPVDIEVWNDLCLPLTIDEAAQWEATPHGSEAEMLASGIVLESPADMATCWPGVWETEKAAERARHEFTGPQNPIREYIYRVLGACEFEYQHSGARQRWRRGWYDPTVITEPHAWLEARLGPLANFALSSLFG